MDVNAALPVVITDSSSLYLYGLSLIAQQQGSTTSYYHQDALGSVRNLTDESGSLTMSYGYDPFGQSTYASGTASNAFRYTGQYLDNQTGLYYLRARYYQPATGRFVTRDPFRGYLDSPLSLNGYAYALNSPLRYFDPSGYDPVDWLNDEWKAEFGKRHGGAVPDANDYAWRFFTMARASGMMVETDRFTNPQYPGAADRVTQGDFAHAWVHGMDIEHNLKQARSWGDDPYGLWHFTCAVFQGGVWDFKRLEEDGTHDKEAIGIIGNFHFGAVAAAYGLEEKDMMWGAFFHLSAHEPAQDHEMILLGAEFYRSYTKATGGTIDQHPSWRNNTDIIIEYDMASKIPPGEIW